MGNIILLSPLLRRLRRSYPEATLDVVVDRAAAELLRGVANIDALHSFAKWQLFGRQGLLATLMQLRRSRYDLLIDAANPTSPSVTHALVARLSGARHTIGSAARGFGRLYSLAVAPTARHEIDLRLALCAPLDAVAPGNPRLDPSPRRLEVAPLGPLPPGSPMPQFLRDLGPGPFVVLNLGARLPHKQLRAADYAVIANACTVAGLTPVLSFGPTEGGLARAVANFSASTVLAPPTQLSELSQLMAAALAVISCDTGPMHLAVALGAPTCALFVSTDPSRYGHDEPPHQVVDLRDMPGSGAWLAQVREFLAGLRGQGGRPRPPGALAAEPTPWEGPAGPTWPPGAGL